MSEEEQLRVLRMKYNVHMTAYAVPPECNLMGGSVRPAAARATRDSNCL